jgi:hypothetical protein
VAKLQIFWTIFGAKNLAMANGGCYLEPTVAPSHWLKPVMVDENHGGFISKELQCKVFHLYFQNLFRLVH